MEFYVIENKKKGLYLYGNSNEDKFKFYKPNYAGEGYRLQAWFSIKQAKVAADEVLGIKEYTIRKVVVDEKDNSRIEA